jgi:hypothetical protein
MTNEEMEKSLEAAFGAEIQEERTQPTTPVTKKRTKEASGEVQALKKRIKELEDELRNKQECKRCGRPMGSDPLQVSDEVMEEYFRCLLGQKPFEKTFKLFGGQLLITFRELPGRAIIENDKASERYTTDAEFAESLDMYLLTSTLKNVSVFDNKTLETTVLYEASEEDLIENAKNPREAYSRLLEKVGQLKIALIRRVSTAFSYLVTALIEKGQDENFYEGAGLL